MIKFTSDSVRYLSASGRKILIKISFTLIPNSHPNTHRNGVENYKATSKYESIGGDDCGKDKNEKRHGKKKSSEDLCT